MTNYKFLEHARLDPLRFAKKIMGLQKMYTISKNMDLSDNYIFCISVPFVLAF